MCMCEPVMLQATNRGLSFNSSSITEGDNEELKLSHLQLAAWNLTGVKTQLGCCVNEFEFEKIYCKL